MTTKTISQAAEVITTKEQLNLPQLDFPLEHFKSGKIREMYVVGEDKLLIVTTDRISAFDNILVSQQGIPLGVPLKGRVLNSMSNLTFALTADIIPNHVITTDMSTAFENADKFLNQLNGRSVLVKKAEPIMFECVVRGYLYGSALEEYDKNDGKVCGLQLQSGLVKASHLEAPIFTPSTKSTTGHDENVSFDQMKSQLCSQFGSKRGSAIARGLREKSIEMYNRIAEHCLERGQILADTKFEFGLVTDPDTGEQVLTVMDEAVTPDSSRIWSVSDYKEGEDQASSNDKQFIRDYLQVELGWTKEQRASGVPQPTIPQEILAAAAEKYVKAYSTFTGYAPAIVSIVMGSKSDEKIANEAASALEKLGVWFGTHVTSAHRTPKKLEAYMAETNADPYVKLHIAIAGLSAALPGVMASQTIKPVIGVPASGELSVGNGVDAVLAMVQMPPGVPVGVAGPINSGKNAGIYAAQILAMDRPELQLKLRSTMRKDE